MAYTTIDDPTAYFQVKTYTGNYDTNAITLDGDSDLQGDLIWLKQTDGSDGWHCYDSVRGVAEQLRLDDNRAESTTSGILASFNTDGFTLGANNAVNQDGAANVAYVWKGGTTASISGGSIATTGQSINATSGFGIYHYDGDGNSGDTLAHGLGKVVEFIITKRVSAVEGWQVYNKGLGNTKYLILDTEAAVPAASSGRWNDTTPTTTLITLGNSGEINSSGNPQITYAFADIQGYQKSGTYEGRGDTTDNTFVYLGFKPAMIIVKAVDTANQWNVFDNKRNTGNPMDNRIWIDVADGATTYASFDFLSNGFKVRNTSVGIGTADTFMYYAVAEAPFVNSNGVPCNAR